MRRSQVPPIILTFFALHLGSACATDGAGFDGPPAADEDPADDDDGANDDDALDDDDTPAGSYGVDDSTLALPRAVDLDPDDDVVRVALRAVATEVEWVPGLSTPALTYGGSSPAPLIEARLGQRLVVDFTNDLDEPTTVHWHGLEVTAVMDGSHISQLPVPPGGTYRYEMNLIRASTYWFHAHVNSNEQVERGLVGVLVVRDPDEDARLDLPTEHVLVLDDVLLEDDGAVAPVWPGDDAQRLDVQMNGREGNHLLVNGRTEPVLPVPVDQPVRLRFVNAANARFMRVSVDGHELLRIGGDQGLVEAVDARPPIPPGAPSDPSPDLGLLMLPGERADVVFVPRGEPGERLELRWHDFPRGRMAVDLGAATMEVLGDDGLRPSRLLMQFELQAASPRDWSAPTPLAELEPPDVSGAVVLEAVMGPRLDHPDGLRFYVDPLARPFADITPETAPTVAVGDTAVWEVTNKSAMLHPFHQHGFVFMPLDIEVRDTCGGEPPAVTPWPRREWMDTVLVPPRPEDPCLRRVLRLATRFDDAGRGGSILASGKAPTETTSGGWLVHCHMLDHARLGMGTFLQIVE